MIEFDEHGKAIHKKVRQKIELLKEDIKVEIIGVNVKKERKWRVERSSSGKEIKIVWDKKEEDETEEV